MSISRSSVDVNTLVDNARKCLIDAQLICQDANKRISLVQEKLSRWQQDINKLYFLLDCLENQYKFLSHEILDISIGKKLIREEWSDAVLNQLINNMKYWQNIITSEINTLNSTENKFARKNSNNEKMLGDFITMENGNILNKKLKEIPIIQKQIENIRAQYTHLKRKVVEQNFDKKLKDIRKEININFDSDNDAKNYLLMITYPDQMKLSVQELAEYITSLVNHFEKCKVLRDNKLEEEDFNELLKVIKNDDLELDSILELLMKTVEDSGDVLKEANYILEEKTILKNQLHSELAKLIGEFQKHHESLLIFKNISEIITIFKKSCLGDINITKQLIHFYKNFENSYQNLNEEVERRKRVTEKMKTVLKNCENELTRLNEEDRMYRKEFILKNGDFLPENILPGQIDDLSPLFTLNYTIRDE
ncbi:hypothetical protein TBLA_0E04520 [Henningerozyma blattae CBS 6284]|uniref:Autophagy-related protein 17 n=1 Tax=Henningerozyma blattae (strain ATCC 34711 / CBS 6284 / DSM 70876 / NBRC 10599 / NRRL Y-10934 / UCD 77-7) TaxID=1071380 RepID=I2H553_HENB6|nr:hypothetical protein TBLA_0E04520 [Tetrapisispora blattae CBS 6284]CCH61505.1 hypothetical protein TBLA_0E04520 [Tetrapisispora blattae CBS 6284]